MPYSIEEAYSLLGLPVGSDMQTVKARYRQLIRQHHPDRFIDPEQKRQAEEHLKKLNTARQIIESHLQTKKETAVNQHAEDTPNQETPTDGARASEEPLTNGKNTSSKGSTEKEQAAWWQERLDVFLTALIALLNGYVKDADKKHPWSKAFDQFGAPVKVTAAARKKRYWGVIFLFLIFESGCLHFFGGEWRRPSSAKPEIQGSPAPSQGMSQLYSGESQATNRHTANYEKSEKSARFDRIYWLKLRLDRDLRSAELNENSITAVSAALTNPNLPPSDRRILLALKANHERDLQFSLTDRSLTLQDLEEAQKDQKKRKKL